MSDNIINKIVTNIPGVIGFYPTESLVAVGMSMMGTTEQTVHMAVGPVGRADLDDSEQITDLMRTFATTDIDYVFAFIVTNGNDDYISEIADTVFDLDSNQMVIGIWHLPEICNDAPYQAVSVYPAAYQLTGSTKLSTDLVYGTISGIAQSESFRQMLAHNDIPEIDRESAYGKFERLGSALDDDVIDAYVNNTLMVSTPDQIKAHATAMLEFIEDNNITDSVDLLDWDVFDARYLIPASCWCSAVFSRDLIISTLTEHPQAACTAMLAIAKKNTGDIRLNALDLYALSAVADGNHTAATMAIRVAHHENPDHSFTRLLAQAATYDKLKEALALSTQTSSQM